MKRMSASVILLAALLFTSLASPAGAWRRTIVGTANLADGGRAVAVLKKGDVIVLGSMNDTGVGPQIFVARLRGDTGDIIWQRRLIGSAAGPAMGCHLVLDRSADIYVCGSWTNGGVGQDMAIAKLDGDTGTVLWATSINGPANGDDMARQMAISKRGQIYVCGWLAGAANNIMAVARLNTKTGAVEWLTQMLSPSAGRGELYGIALSKKTLAVIGRDFGPSAFTVATLAAKTGDVKWRMDLQGDLAGPSSGGDATSYMPTVAIVKKGNVVAVGGLFNPGTGLDLTAVLLRGKDGSLIWRRQLTGGGQGDNQARALAVNKRGDIFVVGDVDNGPSGTDVVVTRLNGKDGKVEWTYTYDGPNSLDDLARGIFVDRAGQPSIVGQSTSPGGADLFITRLGRRGGNPMWERLFIGGAATDTAYSVFVDRRKDVIVIGELSTIGTGADLVVVKLRGPKGIDF